jgi:uncharacterized protein (TIRG00374 family)
VGLAILLFFILNSGIVDNIPIFFKLNAYFLSLALFFSIVNMLLKVVRWHYLSIQYKRPISWTDSSVITFSSFFYANITPGKIGDLFKAYYMKKKFELNLQSGISMIFYERFFEIVILFIFSLLILLKRFDDSSVILLQFTALIIIFLIVFYYKSELILKYSTRVLLKIRKSERFNISFSLQKISLIPVIITFVLSLVSLIFEFGRLWLVILAFGFYLNPMDTAIFFSISIIFGLISQIPLGIGVMEGSLSVLLMRMGIPADYSIAIVLIDRIISMYLALILGFVVSQFSLIEIIKRQEA